MPSRRATVLGALAAAAGARAAEQLVDSVSGLVVSCAQEALLVNAACCAAGSLCAGGIPTDCSKVPSPSFAPSLPARSRRTRRQVLNLVCVESK